MTCVASYISPEIWKGEVLDERGLYQADIYAFGILLNFMVTKEDPNLQMRTSLYQLMADVTKGVRPRLPNQGSCPSALLDIIRSCWHEDTRIRPADFKGIIGSLGRIEAEIAAT